MKSGFPPDGRSRRGFTLLEVLLALVILSVGLLGLATMQINGIRSMQSGLVSTRAVYLAYELSDRMRANPDGMAFGAYGTSVTAGSPDCDGVSAACSAAEMATHDLRDWQSAMQALPAGQGEVVDVGGGRYDVVVRWDELRTGATGTACPPQDDEDLRCIVVGVSM